jgi:hypothetical protein
MYYAQSRSPGCGSTVILTTEEVNVVPAGWLQLGSPRVQRPCVLFFSFAYHRRGRGRKLGAELLRFLTSSAAELQCLRIQDCASARVRSTSHLAFNAVPGGWLQLGSPRVQSPKAVRRWSFSLQFRLWELGGRSWKLGSCGF